MNRFIGGRLTLPPHEFEGGGRKEGGYARAYQEALGGLSVVRVTQSDGPHCFVVTRVMLGPSCVDVLQAMQHKPELMFEALKRWVEEESTAREGRVVDANTVATALARAFRSIPYLVVVGEAGGDEMSSDSEGSIGMD